MEDKVEPSFISQMFIIFSVNEWTEMNHGKTQDTQGSRALSPGNSWPTYKVLLHFTAQHSAGRVLAEHTSVSAGGPVE